MKTTTENNKIIAELMGLSYCEKYQFEGWYKNHEHNERVYELLYDTDWNWLMEVVGRIESLGGAVCIGNGNCVMIVFYIGAVTDESYSKTRELTGETKIEAVYNAVVSFIEWYNSAEKKIKQMKICTQKNN